MEDGSSGSTLKSYVLVIGVPVFVGIAVLKLLYDLASNRPERDDQDRWYCGGWRRD